MGLDIWLLWFLFKRSYLDARRSETLLLTDRELIVDRVAPDGEREQHRLDAYWLRVELLGEAERLVVISRGNRVVIGRFLAPGRAPEGRRAAQGGARRHARAALERDWDASGIKAPARPSCRRGRASCPSHCAARIAPAA